MNIEFLVLLFFSVVINTYAVHAKTAILKHLSNIIDSLLTQHDINGVPLLTTCFCHGRTTPPSELFRRFYFVAKTGGESEEVRK